MKNGPSIIEVLSKIKTVHHLISQQREFSNNSVWINSDDLRSVQNIGLDIVQICQDIKTTQKKRIDEKDFKNEWR